VEAAFRSRFRLRFIERGREGLCPKLFGFMSWVDRRS
jgi:hypothetical protein